MEYDVRDGIVVELAHVSGQLQLPLADNSRAFEWQIALVAEVGLEQPAVVLPTAGDDGLQAAEVVVEAVVFSVLARVEAVA